MQPTALNMMVRTSADESERNLIKLVAVDTGWVTIMQPNSKGESVHHSPLDEVDGASRVLHPVFDAVCKEVSLGGLF